MDLLAKGFESDIPAAHKVEEMVNYFEKMDGTASEQIHAPVRRSVSCRDGHAAEDSKALMSISQPKDTRFVAATPRSLTVATTRKCHSLSDGEVSSCSVSMLGSSLNKDLGMAKLNKGKVLSLIKAWEENKKKRCYNRLSKRLAKLEAWEAGKKARAEAHLRTSEEKLENERAAYIEKARNKIALVQRIAEEKRARAEARHGQQVLKTEETAAKCRASGTQPGGFLCCSI